MSLALELTAITAPRPVALPCSRSTILCIVKFLVGFPSPPKSVPNSKSSAVGCAMGYDYISLDIFIVAIETGVTNGVILPLIGLEFLTRPPSFTPFLAI